MRERPTARSVALEVIRRVTEQEAYSNLALRAVLDRRDLSRRDRALATDLAYGTLRRLVPIDHALGSFVDRPLDTTPAPTLAVLRLGAYQVLFTRIPPHAAVSETVALAGDRHRGFVNAVLRKLTSTPFRWPTGDDDTAIAIRTGLVGWGVRELRRLIPGEVETASRALADRAPVTLRVNTCRVSVEELEGRLAEAEIRTRRGELVPGSLVVESGSPARFPGFQEGWFTVQDQASAFVVRALDPRPGQRVADVCAGPGGKAGHLACLLGPDGTMVAADVSPARAALVGRTAERLGVRTLVLAQDARRPAVRGGLDRVLVDAPCSGIGSARRRPELLWRVRKRDLAGLARLQVGIATAAAGLLAPGGRLVYSVCTFPVAETDEVCEALMRRCPELVPEPIAGPDGPAERVRLWPHRHGCDAMFVASFRSSTGGRR